ncbi:MAG: hypothetical protein RIR00_1949 [Pseudomonadota bacterium]|jgi:CBS domain-containing protein
MSLARELAVWQQAESLARRIALADAPAELPELAGEVRQLGVQLLEQAMAADRLARLLALLNEQLCCRAIELTARRMPLPAASWCWLNFGSAGRLEQTLISDQDNGLVFSALDAGEADALRPLFLLFADAVNQLLAECGFSLCRGGIMAGNPACCLSLEEWQWQFSEWVRRPDPEALLKASIFFDLRPVHGDLALGRKLLEGLRHLVADYPVFLYQMARNALDIDVPLNFLGEVVCESREGGGKAVDLKKSGTRLFVDAVRILALAAGSSSVATRERLQQAAACSGLEPRDAAAMIEAFRQLLRLRFHAQALGLASGSGEEVPLDPEEMHDMERVLLKEALKQARRLQQRLKLNYSL